MQLSIVSFVLATSLLALAAPATPAGLVPSAPVVPTEVNLYNATAGYNATHGLSYNKEVREPLTARDLVARQSYSGEATYYYPGLGACGKTNNQNELVVALNQPQWNNKANCGRRISISAFGKTSQATIVDLCPGCKWGDLDMSPALFQKFTNLGTGRFRMTWQYI